MKKTILLSILSTGFCIAASYAGMFSVPVALGCIGLSWIAVYVYARITFIPETIAQALQETNLQRRRAHIRRIIARVPRREIVAFLNDPQNCPSPSVTLLEWGSIKNEYTLVEYLFNKIPALQRSSFLIENTRTLDETLNFAIRYNENIAIQKKVIQSVLHCILDTKTSAQRLFQYNQIISWAIQNKEYPMLISIIYKIPAKKLSQLLKNQRVNLFEWGCERYRINKNKIPKLILNKIPAKEVFALISSLSFNDPESETVEFPGLCQTLCWTQWAIKYKQLDLFKFSLTKIPEEDRIFCLNNLMVRPEKDRVARLYNALAQPAPLIAPAADKAVKIFEWAIESNEFELLELLFEVSPVHNKLGLITDNFVGSICEKTQENIDRIMSLLITHKAYATIIPGSNNTLLILFMRYISSDLELSDVQISKASLIIQLLLKHESHINHVNNLGQGALSLCLRPTAYGPYDPILLLGYGADPRLLPAYKQSELVEKLIAAHHIEYMRLVLIGLEITFNVAQMEGFLDLAINNRFVSGTILLMKQLNTPYLFSSVLIAAVRDMVCDIDIDHNMPQITSNTALVIFPEEIRGIILEYSIDPFVIIVDSLIKNNANINFVRKSQTLLSLAAAKGYVNVAKLLLKKGAQLTAQAISNPAVGSAQGQEIFKLFLETNTVTFSDIGENNRIAFLETIRQGHIPTIKRTLHNMDIAKMHIYSSSVYYRGIMCWALKCEQTKIVKMFLKHYVENRATIKSTYSESIERKKTVHKQRHQVREYAKECGNEAIVRYLDKEKTEGRSILFKLDLFKLDPQEPRLFSVDTTKVVDLIAGYCYSKCKVK